MSTTAPTTAATTATAPTRTVTAANGVSYAYRRFGSSTDGVPLVFLMHFRGNLDNWDPALIDPIAARREVVLVDNAGVGASTGTVPSTVQVSRPRRSASRPSGPVLPPCATASRTWARTASS